MMRKVLWAAGGLAVLVLVLGLGIYWGYVSTTRIVLSDALEFDAAAVRHYVDVLERLREDDREGATELLESWMDDVLIIVMEPANYRHTLESGAVARVDSAFAEARAYREAYPRTSNRGFVDEMIANVWEAGPPGQFGSSAP